MTTEALWADTCPGSQSGRYWRVGNTVTIEGTQRAATVSRITVQEDEPGMHGHMRRVCIWAGDELIAEVPAHMVAVGYNGEGAT